MGQLRTANKRRKRAAVTLQARKNVPAIVHETDVQMVRVAD